MKSQKNKLKMDTFNSDEKLSIKYNKLNKLQNEDFIQLQNDVKQMKDEIISLKKTINELSKIVKNVYEDTGN